ncbi:unnamed protein product, partial [Didymodactylos carnosus]
NDERCVVWKPTKRTNEIPTRIGHDVLARTELKLKTVLSEPVPSGWFAHYFDSDISTEKYKMDEFCKIFQITPVLGQRLLKYLLNFDYDSTTLIDGSDVIKIGYVLWESTACIKALILFEVFDEDGNKLITKNDMKIFYRNYFKDFNLPVADHESIINTILDTCQFNEDDVITFEHFHEILVRNSGPLNQLFKIPFNDKRPNDKKSKRFFSITYIINNLKRTVFLLFYVLVNVSIIIWIVIRRETVIYRVYSKMNGYIIVAKICAMLLCFNCSFIIVLMLKQTITIIRSSFLRYLLPVDDHISFHRYVGRFIAVLALIHAFAHIADFAVISSPYSWAQLMFTFLANQDTIVRGFAPLSGIVLLLITTVIIICSMEFVRRSGHFEIFYWTHLLYIPLFVMLILHGNDFWKWIVVPGTIFVCEKIYSIIQRYCTLYGKTYVKSVSIIESMTKTGKVESTVIALTINRPLNFDFKPGDYIFIAIPSIATYEWHPYTISSAPDTKGTLTVHVHAVGNWTNKLLEYYKRKMDNRNDLHEVTVLPVSPNQEENNKNKMLTTSAPTKILAAEDLLWIDGPYSSCARYIFDCQHVILIGGGIGITPYASILSSLMAQFRYQRVVCKNCNHVNYTHDFVDDRTLRKVDFIWVNRDIQSFEWFLELLDSFEQEQESYLKNCNDSKRFLDIHLYFTGNNESKSGNVPLALASSLYHKGSGEDIFTHLKSKTNPGRPKWNELFKQINESNENLAQENENNPKRDINVFFCGSPVMAKTVKLYCKKYTFKFHKELF